MQIQRQRIHERSLDVIRKNLRIRLDLPVPPLQQLLRPPAVLVHLAMRVLVQLFHEQPGELRPPVPGLRRTPRHPRDVLIEPVVVLRNIVAREREREHRLAIRRPHLRRPRQLVFRRRNHRHQRLLGLLSRQVRDHQNRDLRQRRRDRRRQRRHRLFEIIPRILFREPQRAITEIRKTPRKRNHRPAKPLGKLPHRQRGGSARLRAGR